MIDRSGGVIDSREKRRAEWSQVNLTQGMVDAIDRYLQSAEARERGLKSRSDVVTQAVRRFLEDEGLFERRPRLMHFDTYQDHVMIVDNGFGRMAGVYFKLPDKAYCELCGA